MAEIKYVSFDKLSKYDGKIKSYIGTKDAEVLASANEFATNLGTNYDKAGAAATVQGKLDEEVTRAKAKEDEIAAAAKKAQDEVDALETLVGTIPVGEDGQAVAASVVAYVDKKTEGIATDAALSQLQSDLDIAEAAIDAIEADYLKAEDKTELATAITAEETRAKAAEKVNADAIAAIVEDYLKAADKTELVEDIAAAQKVADDVQAEMNAFKAAAEVGDAAVDTLKEIQNYITTDGQAAAKMTEDIAANATAIEGVKGRMDTAEADIEAVEGRMTTAEGEINALQAKFGEGEGSVSDMISDAVTAAIDAEEERVDGLLAKKVDKETGKGLSTNDLTNELKANYDAAYAHSQVAHAPANAQANVIESVKVNGTAVAITDKVVDITVPTDNAELTNGAGYLKAADITGKADKATTLAGYGITDAYTSAQVDSAIETAMSQFTECSDADINSLFA